MLFHRSVPAGAAKGFWHRLGRAVVGWYRQRAQYRALYSLDDRTLADIGLRRSEIGSMVAELGGRAEPTRLHLGVHRSWISAANAPATDPALEARARREAA